MIGGLDISSWSKTGIGDLSLMVEWLRDFPQPKPLLKNVRLNLRGGISIPTGVKKDEDKFNLFRSHY